MLGRLLRLHGRKKKSYRDLADDIQLWGWDAAIFLHGPIEPAERYHARIGLTLNKERVIWQRSQPVRLAIGMAQGNDDIPQEYFESICDDPDLAASMEFDANAQRALQRKMSEMGW